MRKHYHSSGHCGLCIGRLLLSLKVELELEQAFTGHDLPNRQQVPLRAAARGHALPITAIHTICSVRERDTADGRIERRRLIVITGHVAGG